MVVKLDFKFAGHYVAKIGWPFTANPLTIRFAKIELRFVMELFR